MIYIINTQLSKTLQQPLPAHTQTTKNPTKQKKNTHKKPKPDNRETVKNSIAKRVLLFFGYAVFNYSSTLSLKCSFSWNTESWHGARCIGSLLRSAPRIFFFGKGKTEDIHIQI